VPAEGGFVIIDDFKPTGFNICNCWERFESNMKRVLPKPASSRCGRRIPSFIRS
jgi:hypothetical protein